MSDDITQPFGGRVRPVPAIPHPPTPEQLAAELGTTPEKLGYGSVPAGTGRMSADAEIETIRRAVGLLNPLDPTTRQRVLAYLTDRYPHDERTTR